MSIVFLIGMPFAGKTYWAKTLSEHYGIPAIDMDAVIEKEAGRSIAYLFETEGEAAFRRKEQNLLHHIIDTHPGPLIVSCGGGTPVFFDNMAVMKKVGCVVYLQATIEKLAGRFENMEQRNARPLLASVTDIEEELAGILKSRLYIYDQADHIIPSENISVSNFDQIFSECINRQ